jgi:hypothetical protein
MAKEQKIVRAYSELELDIKVNELLKNDWELYGDSHLVIKQRNYQNGSDNEEIWYQTLIRDKVK